MPHADRNCLTKSIKPRFESRLTVGKPISRSRISMLFIELRYANRTRTRSPPRRSVEGVSPDDGLIPVGSRRDDRDGHADERLQTLQVIDGIIRQVLGARDAHGRLFPSRQIFVNRSAFAEVPRQQRRRIDDLAVDLVADANADRVEAVEHIELRDAQRRTAVMHDRAAQRDGVEPTAAPPSAGYRSELMADARQMLAVFIEQFGRKRARADTRRI